MEQQDDEKEAVKGILLVSLLAGLGILFMVLINR